MAMSPIVRRREEQMMHRTQGFSLIEVLVSIVVLSIALLGTAGLMSASLRSTNTSYFRSQATILADDILDRMRANLELAKDGEYVVDLGGDCGATTAMALYDCTEWTTMLAETLPAGKGGVRVAADVATVTVEWDGGENYFETQSSL